MNNMRRNNGMPREADELMRKIAALGFVKTELELYLDTHPTCQAALDMYHKTVDELKALTGTEIPYPLRDIDKREVRFKTVIEKQDMPKEVLRTLGLGN